MTRRATAPSIAPTRHERPAPRRGLSRDEAALYVGVGITKFDEMVADRRMPMPLAIDRRVLWDIRELDAALRDGGSAIFTARGGEVYVVTFAQFVKIGWSSDVLRRIAEIELNLPERLAVRATIKGDRRLERELHSRFVSLRTKGEWFRREGDLAAWIEAGCPR
jgi:predicted DNA-binding transcriptional regulator AlpA